MKNIVFSDIDGTLLDSNHSVHSKHIDAIKLLQDKNIPFVIVSARGPSCIYPILNKHNISCPIIAYGGAIILDKNRNILYEDAMSKDIARLVISHVDKTGYDVAYNIYSLEQWIVNDKDDYRIKLEESIVEVDSDYGNIDSINRNVVDKILLMTEVDNMEEIEYDIKSNFSNLSIMKSSNVMLEIMNDGVTKANGCRKLCEMLGVSMKDAYAFGDNYNDIDMLKAVGHGYIMSNAPLELRNQFKNIALSNDEGGIYFTLKDNNII